MNIVIINYPNSLQSAVYGLSEIFAMANGLCEEHDLSTRFAVDIVDMVRIERLVAVDKFYEVILLPPSLEKSFYTDPADSLKRWLVKQHDKGGILCSACAGSFLIAATGLLNQREATTHWGLVDLFRERFPDVQLHPHKILVNDQDIITAGGMMSWLDLGLELIAQFTTPAIMRQLGKMLVVDTGQREQRYYQQFVPKLNHGDGAILQIQRKLQTDYSQPVRIAELAGYCAMTERTFLRRFVKATGIKPSEYLQRLRVQKACDLLENSQDTFEMIANAVGYEDISACRKMFVRVMGLTPGEFKKRFTK